MNPKILTIGDIFRVESEVMELYAALNKLSYESGEDKTLRGLAYLSVVDYRRHQINLVDKIVRGRNILISDIPLLDIGEKLLISEVRELMIIQGQLERHWNMLTRYIKADPIKSPEISIEVNEALKKAGIGIIHG